MNLTYGSGNLDAGLRVHYEQELPGQDGAQGRADLPSVSLHCGCLSPDRVCYGPQGLPHVTILKQQSS